MLELTSVEKLGAKTARLLYQDHGIDSMKALCAALHQGRLKGIKGIGTKLTDTIAGHCD